MAKKKKQDKGLMKQKPELSEEIKEALKLRDMKNKKRPEFHRQEWFRFKRLGDSWRKPRGLHSKMRTNRGYRPNRVRVGYRGPAKVRGLHPSGFEEVLVYNPNDLDVIDPKTQAVRIGHSVGYRKRMAIVEKAEKLGIRVLNKGA
jgi:large subunit ribosomal protein L32e